MSLNDAAGAPRSAPTRYLARYFARFEEGRIIRAAFFGMLIGTGAVLALDLRDLVEANGGLFPAPVESATAVTVPVLPPAIEADEPQGGGNDPREFLTTGQDALREPVRFSLEASGVLKMVGSLDLGSATRFTQEVEARGEYIETISLDSAIARLVRDRGFATRVADGAICASSCPLILAGGSERTVGERAAVGLHQFYAIGRPDTKPEQAMADAQMTTARISRLLVEMEVDPALWLHALDTPPRALYYLSAAEMRKYRLVTGDGKLALRGATDSASIVNR